ncbi:hypothetical protein A3Q56_02628 [Intoshia linei]|uniref:Proteasome assembly chaperone 3 n=1 Tax=Intoshia linei TaxID=1819745 RepID=A0A177B661_9BILA|nr:hypothetical protein A3Q56_02628 [Intoshia linei]
MCEVKISGRNKIINDVKVIKIENIIVRLESYTLKNGIYLIVSDFDKDTKLENMYTCISINDSTCPCIQIISQNNSDTSIVAPMCRQLAKLSNKPIYLTLELTSKFINQHKPELLKAIMSMVKN